MEDRPQVFDSVPVVKLAPKMKEKCIFWLLDEWFGTNAMVDAATKLAQDLMSAPHIIIRIKSYLGQKLAELNNGVDIPIAFLAYISLHREYGDCIDS